MKGYERVRDELHENFTCLNGTQLVKHAFALRTEVHRDGEHKDQTPILFYLYAEPEHWPEDGMPVDKSKKAKHTEEIREFANAVKGDEVRFISCTYRELLADWKRDERQEIRAHAEALTERFSP